MIKSTILIGWKYLIILRETIITLSKILFWAAFFKKNHWKKRLLEVCEGIKSKFVRISLGRPYRKYANQIAIMKKHETVNQRRC